MKLQNMAVSLLFVVAAAGCSASAKPNGFTSGGGDGGDGGDSSSGAGQGGNGGSSGVGGEGGTFFPASGSGGGSSSSSGGGQACSVESQFVYVLSDENELFSFDPPSKVFKKIGTLGCNTTMSPNSMAIDRNAVAWVNYVGSGFSGDNSGAIYKVSTKDASCEASPSVTLPPNWYRVGMGFSTNGVGDTEETLFVTGTGTVGAGDSPGLGWIDMSTMAMKPISQFSPGTFSGQSTELTGTGDARLFGYFTTTPVKVGEINKKTGAVTNTKDISGLATPAAWAFSFWGGDFYLYAAASGSNSNVTHYSPKDGSVNNKYMTNIGFRIVGAGVSTCAPLEQPK